MTLDDMTTSKFSDVAAEAAYAIAGHGFAEDEFGSVDHYGWNALVVVNSTCVLNIGDEELAQRLRAAHPGIDVGADLAVWIREDAQGFVDTVCTTFDHPDMTFDDLLEQFEQRRNLQEPA